MTNTPDLTPDMLLTAYRNGYFPMALAADDPELYWFSPEQRGVLPLETFNIPRGLKRALKTRPYTVTVDTAFEAVIRACGAKTPGRQETWINETIIDLYTALHAQGHAHSVEVWEDFDEGGLAPTSRYASTPAAGAARDASALCTHTNGAQEASHPSHQPLLIGGLYGISIGGAFFGESMFSRAPDASKIALVRLVEILREAGYELLDTQYVNDHLLQFGVEAWSKKRYITKLEKALIASPNPSMRFSTASVRKGAASSSRDNDTSPS